LSRGLSASLASELGSPVEGLFPVAGGSINDAFEVRLRDGRQYFVKSNPSAPAGMFTAEAAGLRWLSEGSALATPGVVAVCEGPGAFLVLEWLDAGAPVPDFDERLGRGLAELHGRGAPNFGFEHDNFIGTLPQGNRVHEHWLGFYRDERLGAQLELAVRQGRASRAMRDGFARLFARLPELLGSDESPARLHGDLWGGNLHRDASGRPALIDPAVYGGHREVDLAMMRLFGGFSERCFAAYDEAMPLQEGWKERVELFQLYPLMVHVNLFGGSYGGSVERVLRRYA
jgi:fructosamine-3-kinase